MTDPHKPRPKVTSHISSTPSHSPSTTYRASVRAKVTPSAITASQTTPGASSRPSLKTTSSSSSLRSHVSASSANTPRAGARSPLPRTPSTPASVPQARVTKPFQPQRSPLTPGFAPNSGNPSSSSSASALGVASGTPVAVPRVRTARSALGVSTVSGVSNSSASKGKNNTENGNGSASGSGYDGSNGYGQTPAAPVVGTSTTNASMYSTRTRTDSLKSTSSVGDRAPRVRVKLQPQPQSQAQTWLHPKSSSQFTSPPSTSSPSPTPQAQTQNQNQNRSTHLPPHVPYHLLTNPTASAPTSPTPFTQPQSPDIQPTSQGPHPPSPLSSTSAMTTSFTATTMTTKRRTSKPRLPPMILHPSERQQALKEGRKVVGWLGMGGVGRGMRMMPGSPERKTVELPDLTPAAPGTPGLEEKGEEEWEGENGLYADERGEQGDLGREEYQSLYENGNENDNDNDDKHGCEYKHRYEYDYVKDNENGERYSIENRNGKRNAEQVEVTSVLPIVGDRQDSSKGGEEGEAKRKCVGENGVEAEAEAGAGTEIGGEQEQEVDDMLVTDAVEAKINRKVADLEISNASLLAINKSLEATKSKQRAEIGKLRRRLRETLAFPHLGSEAPGGSSSGLDFGLGLGVGASSLEEEADPESEHDLSLFLLHEAEMADPQLDARWSKMEDLVVGMKKAAEEALRRGEEEGSREGRGRVLGWAEMEEMEEVEEGDVSFTSEGAGERSEEEGTVS
ncbi:hypothetical protein CNE00380 [Cryptococcus deneoformans JEC21]|uniref:Uncharacterized protein n=1 Tax=Cryptococcus deneoformans (strain JEC21 / ATCC MYA-565) TaxID=214684 RepID=Q5KHE1_CRYD1|nr:hypothetical protein CNE00380 [Cryptococcus neoformans var. neoformans JEC21]AAW43433.1 hypothetical protein CNE00380 [Cryptococcus neoformans var. neoformans JEC21]